MRPSNTAPAFPIPGITNPATGSANSEISNAPDCCGRANNSRCAPTPVADSSINPPLITLVISLPSSPPCKKSGMRSICPTSIWIAPCVSETCPLVEQFLQPISIGTAGSGTSASRPARKLGAAKVVSMNSVLRSNVAVTLVSGVSAGMVTLNAGAWRARTLEKVECRRKRWSSFVWPKAMSKWSKADCQDASVTESSRLWPSLAKDTSSTLRCVSTRWN